MATMPITFGDFTLDEPTRQLLRGGEPVRLSPKTFQLLSILASDAPRAISKADIQERLWPGTFVTESSLAALVTELRSVLGDDAREPRYIRTLYGFGYAFIAPVQQSASVQVPPKVPLLRLTRAAAFGAVSIILLMASRSMIGSAPIPSQSIRSLAILPFDTSEAERSDQHLGLGLPDLLITRLSNVHQIIVRPTSAIREFAGHHGGELTSIGRKLQVDAVLEGSIRTSPDRVRVTVQLLNVGDQKPIWADHFDEKRTEMFSIEDNVSARVAEALTQRLTPTEKSLLSKKYTENPEAYELYIEGRSQLEQIRRGTNEFTRENALRLYEKAVQVDPSFALAWAGLAGTYNGSAYFGELPPQVAYPKAETAIQKALQLDESLSEAHQAAAFLKMNWDLDYSGAEREFRRALDLNPRNTSALLNYEYFLLCLRRFDESAAVGSRAIDIDPTNPSAHWTLATVYLTSRQDELGIRKARLVLAMDPRLSEPHVGLSRVYTMRGLYDQAFAEAREAMRFPNARLRGLAFLGYALGMSGNKSEASKVLEQLTEEDKQLFDLAIVHMGLGDRETVFQLLEKGIDNRNGNVALRLNSEPIWEPLRSDQRFQALLRRAGFNGN